MTPAVNAQSVINLACEDCRDANNHLSDFVNFGINQVFHQTQPFLSPEQADFFRVTNPLGQTVELDVSLITSVAGTISLTASVQRSFITVSISGQINIVVSTGRVEVEVFDTNGREIARFERVVNEGPFEVGGGPPIVNGPVTCSVEVIDCTGGVPTTLFRASVGDPDIVRVTVERQIGEGAFNTIRTTGRTRAVAVIDSVGNGFTTLTYRALWVNAHAATATCTIPIGINPYTCGGSDLK